MPQRDTEESIRMTALATIAPIITKQNEYRSTHRTFYQQLWTHSNPPENGMVSIPDRKLERPTDQEENVVDIGASLLFPVNMRARCKIDVWESLTEEGWALTCQYRWQRQLRQWKYRWSRNKSTQVVVAGADPEFQDVSESSP